MIENTLSHSGETVTAIPRVAVFSWNDDWLVQAVAEAGLKVAYLYDSDFGTEHLVFEDIPTFGLIAASLPDGGERRQALELVLVFVRARLPVSFVLMCGMPPDSKKFSETVCQKVEMLGYRVENVVDKGYAFVVGTMGNDSFVWPPGIVTGTRAPG